LLGESKYDILLQNISGGEAMTEKIYTVALTKEERAELTAFVIRYKRQRECSPITKSPNSLDG